MHEASHYLRLDNGKVRCTLCPHHCLLRPGMRGICLTRRNVDGMLVSLNYCRPVSLAIDPIEKKPLYHFHPGSRIFSTGPNGCSFKCEFCQNCDISQQVVAVREMPAGEIAREVVDSSTIGIAYTYSEPTIWFETIMDVGTIVKQHGLVNVLVTNGFVEPAPLSKLVSIVDAMNIDIKSIRPAFYRRYCKARLEPVLRTCEMVRKHCHLEVTNLLIPGLNDSEDDVRDLCRYIAANLGKDTPLHLSRYFPRHRMDLPPTPRTSIVRAWEIARASLDYVYVGNLDMAGASDTQCATCKTVLVQRQGYAVRVDPRLTRRAGSSNRAKCPECGSDVPLVVGRPSA